MGNEVYVNEDTDSMELVRVAVLNLLLIIQITLSLMDLLRVIDDFVSLVQLIGQCLKDVAMFSMFLLGWILNFGLMFSVLGVEVNHKDYENLQFALIMCIQTYRNSIGDISPPIYTFWKNRYEQDPTITFVMIQFIWVVWIFQQFLVFIILLNFLIAIVSNSYEDVMKQQVVNKYKHRAELNCQCQRVLHTFKLDAQLDVFLITANCTEEKQQTDWDKFQNGIKQYVTEENTHLHKRIQECETRCRQDISEVNERLTRIEELLEKGLQARGNLKYQSKVEVPMSGKVSLKDSRMENFA